MLYLGLAFVVIGLLTLLEMQRGASVDRNRILNIANWGVRLAMAYLLARFIPKLAPYSVFDLGELPWIIQFLIFLLLIDFAEYLFHRAQHAIPWLWALHSLHHSDPDMNATTTERHHWADQFLKFLTIYPAVVVLVAADESIGLVYLLLSLWNYVAHASIPLSFGRYSWVFQSSVYHRVHHSNLPEHYNSNFCALLPIWDVIFGTYRKPDGWPPTGLDVKPERLMDLITWPIRLRRPRARLF